MGNGAVAGSRKYPECVAPRGGKFTIPPEKDLKIEQSKPSRTFSNETAQSQSGKIVYLTTTSFDLNNETDQIRRELIARGHEVVPDRPLPLIASELEEAVQHYLDKCHLSVHLFGKSYGVIPDGADQSLIDIQNNLAAQRSDSRGLERIIWMPASERV